MFVELLLGGFLLAIIVWQRYVLAKRSKTIAFIRDEKPMVDAVPLDSVADAKHKEMEILSIVATQTENAIMIMDPKGNIEWINDGFTRMYEFTFDEFITQKGKNILQTSFDPQIKERLTRCIETLKPVTYEALNITVSGKEIWTHTSLNPILNEQGELVHLATIDSDVSLRIAAGNAILQRIEILTSKINDLTIQQNSFSELTNQLVASVQESAQQAEQADSIVSYINDVSDKVKIMGLNATIEAHSVGSHGAGFRVISGEIVKMSGETKYYASQINQIVEGIKLSSLRLEKGRDEMVVASKGYVKLVDDLRLEVNLVEEVAARLNSSVN